MNENFTPLFGGGATDPQKKIETFGKRGAEKMNGGNSESPEEKFARFLADTASTGDTELDELRTDYIALQAFNELAEGSGLYDSMEEKKMRKQIMEQDEYKKAA